MNTIELQIGKNTYTATLCENETAKAFLKCLPMQAEMQELNGNEKYVYLSDTLPSAPQTVSSIQAGDIMLFGSDCVVLFYKNFTTSYRYTRIGSIDDPEGLVEAVGTGVTAVIFQPLAEP